jgi:hypothetical protein
MTSVVHLLEKGLKPRKLHYYEMEVFRKKLRVKYRNAQTQIEMNEKLEDVFSNRKVLDTNVEEIDKYATKNDVGMPLHELEERYFRVFQENAQRNCPIFDPTKTYKVSEVVQFTPKKTTRIKYSLNDTEGFVELNILPHCFWMCTRNCTGQTPADLGVEIDYDKDYSEYIAKYNLAHAQIEENSIQFGKTPSIDWAWTDWGWKVEPVKIGEKDKAKLAGTARDKGHYPGNKYWVCLHFDGTGSYDTDTDQLIVNHKQIWLIRAKILSQVISSYGNLLNRVKTYNRDGPLAVSNLMGQGLRNIFTEEAGAFDAIQKYTRDLEDISAFTVDKSMDIELNKDPRIHGTSDVETDQTRWQFFYTQDFMRKVPTGKNDSKTGLEIAEWVQHDMWGYDFHKDATGRKIYTDGCFEKLTAIMKNQSHHRAEIFLRRTEPRNPDFPDRILPSPIQHWEKRRNYWNSIFSQFHGQVEGWWDHKERYHYGIEYFLKTLTETAVELTQENKIDWKITTDEEDFKNNLEQAVRWNNGQRASASTASWHPTVYVVREFVARGMHYFIQEEKDIQEQRVRSNDMVAEMGIGDGVFKKMVRTIIKYIKPSLWLIEETLQHFYSERELYSMHRDRDGTNVRVGEHDLKDWGKFDKQLLFKILMLEGLCIQRGWLNENKLHHEFHAVAKAWQTKGNRLGTSSGGVGFGASWVTRRSFQQIWPQQDQVVDLAKYKWIFDVLFTKYDNPADWGKLGIEQGKFEMKTEGTPGFSRVINPSKLKDYPWLHHEYLRPLRHSESSEWFNIVLAKHQKKRTKYEYIMYIHKMYMKNYQLWMTNFKDKYPRHMGSAEMGTTVYSKIKELRKEHIGFIKGYIPTHRVWHHPQYGCLCFGRLIETIAPTLTYKKFMFHVVAHAVEVKDDDVLDGVWMGSPAKLPTAPSDNKKLTIFQWQVNGFSDDDMVESWLSENKGLFWRTMWKSPFVDIGAGMISDITLEELRKGYEHTKGLIEDELKEWDAKVIEGKDLTKLLLTEEDKLKDLKAHMRAMERSIKSLEGSLEVNKRAKQQAVAKTQQRLTEAQTKPK